MAILVKECENLVFTGRATEPRGELLYMSHCDFGHNSIPSPCASHSAPVRFEYAPLASRSVWAAKHRPIDFVATLQFALNLLQFVDIAGGEYLFARQNYGQHIYESVCRDGCQFAKHRVPPWEELKIDVRIRNPTARCEHLQANENDHFPLA
jgi:hypothetical protein